MRSFYDDAFILRDDSDCAIGIRLDARECLLIFRALDKYANELETIGVNVESVGVNQPEALKEMVKIVKRLSGKIGTLHYCQQTEDKV